MLVGREWKKLGCVKQVPIFTVYVGVAAKVARCYQNYHTYTITRNNYNLMICDDARELQKCEHTCFVPISQAAQTIPGLNGCGTLAPGSTGKILAAQVFPQDFLDLS